MMKTKCSLLIYIYIYITNQYDSLVLNNIHAIYIYIYIYIFEVLKLTYISYKLINRIIKILY